MEKNTTQWGFVSEVGNISSMGIEDPTVTNVNIVTENTNIGNQNEADKIRNEALNDFLNNNKINL